ncbi:hypothetical protein BY458DRAFT_507917 [Sporodiniella umbellata]|nr:hypothetical protein BY458DRAFT_507917 [Sporodiniella umbellata]
MFSLPSTEKPNFVSFMLKKKKSSWSLHNFSKKTKFFQHNNLTTCSLFTTALKEEDPHDPTLPPTYDDKSHPWAFQFPKSMINRDIQPREEEGEEKLPDYECTLERTAGTYVKCEWLQPEVRSKKRIWRYLYLRINGTLVSAYKHKQCEEPAWSYSMQGAQVSVATDYLKHRYVLRLEIANGPQFLIKTCTESEKFEWLEAMESSINISSDLEYRNMPQFITLRVRHRRQLNHRPTDQALV